MKITTNAAKFVHSYKVLFLGLALLAIMLPPFLLFLAEGDNVMQYVNRYSSMVNFLGIYPSSGLLIGLIFVCVFLHELIHYVFARLYEKDGLKNIRIGYKLGGALVPHVNLEGRVKIFHLRVIVIMPLLLLGVIPYGISFLLKDLLLFVVGLSMILGGAGDLYILYSTRRFKNEDFALLERSGKNIYSISKIFEDDSTKH